MTKPDRCAFTPIDFQDWRTRGILALQPKFQRREVWSAAKKSYLIDTLLKEMPVPPIFLRVAQGIEGGKNPQIVREVIDGQQRIAAVLDFIEGKFSLSKSIARQHGAATFDKLSPEKQKLILRFSFACEVFHGISDAEVLEIFARVNTYSVQLNRQELLNGKYFGPFKQSAYRLAHEHLEFWRRHRIFRETAVARMSDVELTSELVVVLTDGMQHKKDPLESFYEKYDTEFPAQTEAEKRFRAVIDSIEMLLGDALKDTEFHRPPFFYTLFAVVGHRLFGIPGQTVSHKKSALKAAEAQSVRDVLLRLSELISKGKTAKGTTGVSNKFIDACLKSTDKLPQRQIRFDTIYKQAFA